MRRFLVPLLLLAFPAVAAEAPSVPLYKTFGRWIVACDNVRSCEARGFDDHSAADLRVIRGAGQGTPSVTFGWDKIPDRATLRLDGQPLELPAPAWSVTADQTISTSDPAAITTLVATLKDAKEVTFGTGDDAGTIPLQGFVAALLLMDAVQGRPGTLTALMAARGNNGPPGAPGLPGKPAWHAPPALPAAESSRLISRVLHDPVIIASRKSNDCDSTMPATATGLDATTALVLAPCALYAYQASTMAVLVPRAGGAPKPFSASYPGLAKENMPQDAFLVEGEFDPKTGTLSTVAKGRGIADCGISASWIWSRAAFQLTRLDYLDPCGGSQPGDWPTIYRTAP